MKLDFYLVQVFKPNTANPKTPSKFQTSRLVSPLPLIFFIKDPIQPFLLVLGISNKNMGGLCSRSAHEVEILAHTAEHLDANHKYGGEAFRSFNIKHTDDLSKAPQVREVMEKKQLQKTVADDGKDADDDTFYDGIPRFIDSSYSQKCRSVRPTQAAVAKVSEVSSRLGRAGTVGLGKARDVLDTLGSSMTNLNAGSGFSGVPSKGSEVSILAFEIANTIVKGSNLMLSLSKRNIKHIKEEVLISVGVQDLVSKDMDILLAIVAADKREELKIFSNEVIRFGNRSKDPQWHNLDRYFDKISSDLNPQRQLKDEAELVMEQLMSLVQFTAELYQEMHSLDRFEQDYERKHQEEDFSDATERGDGLSILRAELKRQRKQVKTLKKKSLWSRSLEEVMEKLVDIVQFLHIEIHDAFGSEDNHEPVYASKIKHQRLGPAGLSLHYANIVLQIDTLVARSASMPANTRETLYQSLPPNIKTALRRKLLPSHFREKLSAKDIKAEMEKTLGWLVPVATNTVKDHHGFGWVGEWANNGSQGNRKTGAQNDIIRIETFHHANKDKVEAYILELLVWLQRLFLENKAANEGGVRTTLQSRVATILQNTEQPANELSMVLTTEDHDILQGATQKRRIRGISKSLDFDYGRLSSRKNRRLSKSNSSSPVAAGKEWTFSRMATVIPVFDFYVDKERALDVIDRLDVVR